MRARAKESLAGLRAAIASCGTGVSSGDVEISLKDGAVDDQPVQMLLTLIAQRSGGAHTGCCSSVLQTETQMITAIGQDLTEVMAMKEMQLRKTRITAVLGHELRSPLHGIMGLSGSMAESAPASMCVLARVDTNSFCMVAHILMYHVCFHVCMDGMLDGLSCLFASISLHISEAERQSETGQL